MLERRSLYFAVLAFFLSSPSLVIAQGRTSFNQFASTRGAPRSGDVLGSTGADLVGGSLPAGFQPSFVGLAVEALREVKGRDGTPVFDRLPLARQRQAVAMFLASNRQGGINQAEAAVVQTFLENAQVRFDRGVVSSSTLPSLRFDGSSDRVGGSTGSDRRPPPGRSGAPPPLEVLTSMLQDEGGETLSGTVFEFENFSNSSPSDRLNVEIATDILQIASGGGSLF